MKNFGGPRPPLGPINDSPLFVPDSLNPNSYWQSLKITRIYIYIYIVEKKSDKYCENIVDITLIFYKMW